MHSNYVFVVDANRRPLNPVHPAKSRKILNKGNASVLRMYPFTIILHRVVDETTIKPLTLRLDPGSKVTGIALVIEETDEVIWVAELEHRGQAIKKDLDSRRASRCNRRNRKTRYRAPRFLNRKRKKGWLAPSLMHRVLTTETWVNRIIRYAPVTQINMELVKFDMQKMQDPEISGVEYQQGSLYGYEVREYLLEKWGRECAYCGEKNVPLQIEHIVPKSKGGSNRVSNLTLSCECCNQKKGNKPIEEFLNKDHYKAEKIKSQAKRPLKDAASVNATRWELFNTLSSILPTKTFSGAYTKATRIQCGFKKEHYIDAACAGGTQLLTFKTNQPLRIKSTGHGRRQMSVPDKYGFPRTTRTHQQEFFGFRTGSIVRAIVKKGKKVGEYVGRVAVRATGSFNITTKSGTVQGISHKYCQPIHKKDGYSYGFHGD